MDFSINKDGNTINCQVISTYHHDETGIDYIVYTDGTLDSKGLLEIYASRYRIENDNYILTDIMNDREWDLIDKLLELKVTHHEQ